MPRYCIERELANGPNVLTDDGAAELVRAVLANNLDDGVTWLHSYVTPDRKHSFCICEAPTPEAVRRASTRNKLPIKQIFEVRVVDPYCCR
jgi:hypothetical protein